MITKLFELENTLQLTITSIVRSNQKISEETKLLLDKLRETRSILTDYLDAHRLITLDETNSYDH